MYNENAMSKKRHRRGSQQVAKTDVPAPPSRVEVLWQAFEHPLTLTAIGFLLAAIAYYLELVLFLAWFFFLLALYRTKIFDQLSRNGKVLAYPAAALAVAVLLYAVHSKLRESFQSVRAPSDPVVHIEPEEGLLWSVGPGQTHGVFTLTIANTGQEDVEHVDLPPVFSPVIM